MAVFQTTRLIPVTVPDLAPVAEEVMQSFRAQGYEVTGQQLLNQGWHISLHKGNMFKAVLGMKSALNLEIEPAPGGTSAKAGVGIFGMQALPSVISMFLFWPVLVTQIWGMVQQSKLDDEAVTMVERSLSAHAGVGATLPATGNGKYCPQCGTGIPATARFCPQCGVKAS